LPIYLFIDFLIKTFKNGIKLQYIKEKTDYISFCLTTKAGYSYEPSDKIGLTHLYEHVFVSMLENLHNYGKYTEKLGFYQNADTSNTLMNVYGETYKSMLPDILLGMKNQIENFLLMGKVFSIEKDAVKNEVSKRNLSYDEFIENYAKTLFLLDRNRRVQTIKTTMNLTIKDLLKIHNFIFSKNNVIFTIYGKLTKKQEKAVNDIISSISLTERKELKDYKNNTKPLRFDRSKVGIIAFRVPKPNFKDYLAEQIYKNIMTRFDDSLLYKFIRENEKATYAITYDSIDGINERLFYFYFIGNPKNVKNVKKKIDFHSTFFKQTKKLFNIGKRRTIIEFLKSAETQTDFTEDLAYYYATFGASLDKKSLIKEIEKLKYSYYKKWLKRIYANTYIL